MFVQIWGPFLKCTGRFWRENALACCKNRTLEVKVQANHSFLKGSECWPSLAFFFFARFEVVLPTCGRNFFSLHGKEGKSLGVLGEQTSNPISPPLATFPVDFFIDILGKPAENVANGDPMLQIVNASRFLVMWPESPVQQLTMPGCDLTGPKRLVNDWLYVADYLCFFTAFYIYNLSSRSSRQPTLPFFF